MKRIILCLMTLCFLSPAVVSYSAPYGGPGGPEGREKLEKTRDKIIDIRNEKMKKALALDESTAERLFAVLDRYDLKRASLRRDLIEDMKALRQSVRKNNESMMRTTLERMEDRARMLQDLRADERRELKGVLSIEQQAKYVLFQAAFAREVRKKISEMRRERKDVSQDAIW